MVEDVAPGEVEDAGGVSVDSVAAAVVDVAMAAAAAAVDIILFRLLLLLPLAV